MSKDQIEYSIRQLKEMLRVENDPDPKVSGYGAHLSHWYGTAKSIQLDAKAINALIKHFERRKAEE